MELTGSPSSLAYPDVCARCGSPTRTRLAIAKAFRRTSDEGRDRHVIIGARVPFCPACVAVHEREVKRMSRLWRALLCFRSTAIIGALGPALFAGLLTQAALQRALYGETRAVAMFGGAAALFALIAAFCIWQAYRATRRFAIPAPTSVTRAFDFGDDRSQTFDAPRHVYQLSNATFAEAFRAANRERHWNPTSPRARRAAWARWIVVAVIILAALIVALLEPLKRLAGL